VSKLEDLQELITNDLRLFRRRFFPGMVPQPLGAGAPGFTVDSLEVFENMPVSGIVGGRNPSRYSESPDLWNPYFRKVNRRGVFFAFDLLADCSVGSFLEHWLRIPGALDLTVTDPFKQEACAVMGSLPLPVLPSQQVEETQTVNHLILDETGGRIFALNTDGLGMVGALRNRTELAGKRILLLGAGATAASIGLELVRRRCTLWIANRTAARARALVETLSRHASLEGGAKIGSLRFDEIRELLPGIDVLISTVSAGCPIGASEAKRLSAGAVIAESKYGAKADLAGLACGRIYLDGRAMLFGQFAKAAEVAGSLLGVSPVEHRRAVQFLEARFF
jgi:shikimate 5-dehydrogenase